MRPLTAVPSVSCTATLVFTRMSGVASCASMLCSKSQVVSIARMRVKSPCVYSA